MIIKADISNALDVKSHINDTDLVEIAGFHAYEKMNRRDSFSVNGKQFKVVHVIKDPRTGFDAFTVQNTTVVDGEEITETTIVYAGTDNKSAQDLKTDLNLLGDTPPAQLEKGLWYLNEVKKK